jgi:hypothetical protein
VDYGPTDGLTDNERDSFIAKLSFLFKSFKRNLNKKQSGVVILVVTEVFVPAHYIFQVLSKQEKYFQNYWQY